MKSSLIIEPLDASFGARVTGIRLADLDQTTFDAIYQHWLEYALLIFPEQHLTNDEQVSFARRIGELEFDLAAISNVRRDGSVRPEDDADSIIQTLKGNMDWHCDSTYMPTQAKAAVFTAHVVPTKKGATGWADLRAGYDVLDEDMIEKIAGLAAYHSLYHSQQKAGFSRSDQGDYKGYGFFDQEPPLRPLVKIHPETGRPNLLIGRHAYGIPGLDKLESEALLDELLQITCQPPRVYYHHWQVGDAVLWDNRCLLHRACAWDMKEPRVMYHARVRGDASELADQALQR